jgi:micrococcal nuclease
MRSGAQPPSSAPVWKSPGWGFCLRRTTAVAGWGMSPPNKFTYPISNIRIIDGDTIEADVDLGFRIRQRQIIRLAGIDAPELRAKDPEERRRSRSAKIALERMLLVWQPAEILMHSIGLDKYGRSLAVIWASDGSSWDEINAMLVEQGYATPAEEKRK